MELLLIGSDDGIRFFGRGLRKGDCVVWPSKQGSGGVRTRAKDIPEGDGEWLLDRDPVFCLALQLTVHMTPICAELLFSHFFPSHIIAP